MGEARKRGKQHGATKPTAVFNDSPFPSHPSVTSKVWEKVLLLLSEGKGLLNICKDNPTFPSRATILRAIADGSDENRDKYARAMDDGADAMVEEAMEIADDSSRDTITKTNRDGSEYEAVDHEWIARSKLRVEQRRWHASKLRPKKYGDKQEVTVREPDREPLTIKDDLAPVLERLRQRGLL